MERMALVTRSISAKTQAWKGSLALWQTSSSTPEPTASGTRFVRVRPLRASGGATYADAIPERVATPESLINNIWISFDNTYLDSWLEITSCIRMVRSVNRSEVVGPLLIQSPVLGPIPPISLSGGVKTLPLVRNDRSRIFNASTCGDNCPRRLLSICGWFLAPVAPNLSLR